MTSPFSSCPLAALAEAIVPEAFCAFEIPVQMNRPRMILAIGASSLLALERGTGSVILVEDSDQDGVPDSRRLVVSANGLSYGLALHDGFIYALSDQAVFRWSYESTSEDRIANIGAQETVVDNINMNGQGSSNTGNHSTRTLAFDAQGRLYVSVGSVGNVDVNSSRSRIRRFSDLTPSLFPIDFLQGEVFADGVRNEVGLAFDRHGILWGAENGADNPAEEMHRFPDNVAGSHFGYPFCWTEYLLPEDFQVGRGTVWAWPSFLDAGMVTDQDCRANYLTAEVSMQAHSAPLGIRFYQWKDASERPAECHGAFPQEMDGYAFIAFHGSWNRDIPTGYNTRSCM